MSLVYRPDHPRANANGMVAKALVATSGDPSFLALSDIAPFVTQEGTEITSRSHLRAYEQARGIRQVGSDWSGPAKPAFWDSVSNKRREI